MALTQQERDRKKRLAEQQLANAPRDAQGNILGKNQAGRTIAVVQGTRNATDTADLTTTKLAKDQPKTSASGVQVGEKRDVPGAISADQMTPTSYEQIGAIQQEQDYQGTKDVADALGLAENAPSDLEAYIKAQVNAKKAQDKSQQLALEGQRMDLRSQAGAVTSQAEAAQAMAASGLNAPQSNLALSGGYQEAAKAQMDRLKIDDQQIALYDTQLKQAQLDGDLELAQSIQANKDAYVNQAMANEAAYVSALGDYEKTKAAVTQSNLASFQSLVDEGQELSVEAISGFAGQLGIPFEDAYGYYAGVQSIRDDKSLSLEEKEALVADTKYTLDQKMKGLSTKEAQAVSDYMTLVKSGNYTPEQLQAFAISMNIPDENNPVYLADLAVKQAEAKIKTAEANGEIVNPADKLEYAEALRDYYETNGITPGTVPSGGSVQTTAVQTGNGIEFNFTSGDKISSGKRQLSQCGQFVNDVLGTSMGDSLASKMKFVDENIYFPEPGMGFVTEDGIILASGENSGHTGIVEYYDPVTQMVGVADVNSRNDGVARHHEIALAEILDGGGFVPGTGEPMEGSTGSAGVLDSQIRAVAADIGATEGDRAQIAKDLKALVNQGYTLAEAKSETGYISKSDKELQKNMEDEIKDNRTNFNEINSKLASIPSLVDSESGIGDVATIVNFLKVIDPNSVARETEVQSVENATSLIGRFSQAFNKAMTGEKLTDEQRADILNASTILRSSMADYYLTQLYGRQQELEGLGVPMTFTSKTQIQELERVVGADRVEQIKQFLGASSAPLDEDTIYQEAEKQAEFDSLAGTDDEEDIYSIFN